MNRLQQYILRHFSFYFFSIFTPLFLIASMVILIQIAGFFLGHDKPARTLMIFGFLGIARDEFDFENGYSQDKTHTYTTAGDKTVKHIVESTYSGYSSECEEDIQIRYQSPSATLTFSDESPVLGDVITVANSTLDNYSTVTTIKYFFDGNLIAENTELEYSYDVELDTVGDHVARIEIYWNDYYEDKVIIVEKTLEMANIPPEIELTIDDSQSDEGIYVANVTASDPDGEIDNIPVVAVSAKISAEEEAELLDMGFFDFIPKPIHPIRLLARVRRALRQFEK